MHILGFAKHLKFFPLCVLFQQWAAEKLQKSTSVCRSFCQGDKIVKIFLCQKYQLEDAEVKKKNEDAFVLLGVTVNLLIVDFPFSPILSLLSLFHMTNRSERKVFLEIRLKSLSINFCQKLYILHFDQFPCKLCLFLEYN